MFRFEHPDHLYALIAIPIIIAFYLLMNYRRKQALQVFGNPDLIERLAPEASLAKHGLKLGLLMAGLFFLIIGWANPQWGTKKEKVKQKSVDVFIAIDVSHSMLAQDITPNRMERAKKFTQNLITKLKGDRLGTIIFAGNAYLQMPLTMDYAQAMILAKSTNTNMVPSQGTAISEAIQLAMQSFEEDNNQQKALVIITDGENHEKEAIAAAKKAKKAGALLFTIGVGTAEGGPIPIYVRGRNDFKRNPEGQVVRSQLNEEMLRKLAKAGGGSYFNLRDDEKIITALKTRIDKIEKREFEQRVFTDYESYFQYFVFIGLLFIVGEFMISYRKNKWAKNKDLFKV